MRLGIFSDLHLHNHKPFSKPLGGGLNTRAVYGLNILRQLKSVAVEERLDAIGFCGDFWHTRGYVLVSLFKTAYVLLEDLAQTCDVFMIGGNHDAGTTEDDPPNAITLFEDIPGVFILDNAPVNMMGLVLLYGTSNGQLPKITEGMKDEGIHKIALLHLTIKGTTISPAGWEATHGISMNDLTQWLEDNHISACFIGDIHLRQELSTNFWYVGSCMQHEFGDEQTKGMLIYDTEREETSFKPLEAPEFITLTDTMPEDDYNYYRVITTSEQAFAELSKGASSNVKVLPPAKQSREARTDLTLDLPIQDTIREYVKTVANKKDFDRLVDVGLKLALYS